MGISFKSIQSVLSHHASFLALSFGRIRRERTGWPTVRGLWKVVRSERTSPDARRHQRGELEDAFPLFLSLGGPCERSGIRVREGRESALVPMLHGGPIPPPAAAFRSVGSLNGLGPGQWPSAAFAEWATQPGRAKEAREAHSQLLLRYVLLLPRLKDGDAAIPTSPF